MTCKFNTLLVRHWLYCNSPETQCNCEKTNYMYGFICNKITSDLWIWPIYCYFWYIDFLCFDDNCIGIIKISSLSRTGVVFFLGFLNIYDWLWWIHIPGSYTCLRMQCVWLRWFDAYQLALYVHFRVKV